MELPPENSTSGTLKWSWLLAGGLLSVIGLILFLTLLLAPVGIAMMFVGVGVIIFTVVKAGRNKRPGPDPQSGV
jgi:multisubunit Na+/H+ antiporter MnhC subunit